MVSWKFLTGHLFHLYPLFLFAVFLFNLGLCGLEIFGLNKYGILQGRFNDDTLLKAIFFTIICIHSLHTGAMVSFKKVKYEEPNLRQQNVMLIIGKTLLVISILPTIVIIYNYINVVVSSGYMGVYNDLNQITSNRTLFVLSNLLMPATFFLIAGSKNKPKTIILSLL